MLLCPDTSAVNTVGRFDATTTAEVVYVGMTSDNDLLVRVVVNEQSTTFCHFPCLSLWTELL